MEKQSQIEQIEILSKLALQGGGWHWNSTPISESSGDAGLDQVSTSAGHRKSSIVLRSGKSSGKTAGMSKRSRARAKFRVRQSCGS